MSVDSPIWGRYQGEFIDEQTGQQKGRLVRFDDTATFSPIEIAGGRIVIPEVEDVVERLIRAKRRVPLSPEEIAFQRRHAKLIAGLEYEAAKFPHPSRIGCRGKGPSYSSTDPSIFY